MLFFNTDLERRPANLQRNPEVVGQNKSFLLLIYLESILIHHLGWPGTLHKDYTGLELTGISEYWD